MKKLFFFFVFAFLIIMPCAIFMTGCSKEQLVGISAQRSKFEISYGEEFDPMTKFSIRSHYLDGKVEKIEEKDLTYTITKNDEDYELEDLFDAGSYIITFTYKEATCDTYLNVKKVSYTEKSNVLIDNFFFNDTISMPELDVSSDGNITYYYEKLDDEEDTITHEWTYEEGDINETITPGNYQIYARVDEGTNYKSYRTEAAKFHVSPEKLDESYSLTAASFDTTFIPGGKLSDYDTQLSSAVKLQKYDEDSDTTNEIEGTFNFVENQKKLVVADSGKSLLIAFNSTDENLNGKEFLIPVNVEKLKIVQPKVTTSTDPTEITQETIYNGAEQSLHVVTDYTYTFDEEEQIYSIKSENGTLMAVVGGKLKHDTIGNYDFHISLFDKENTCWEDETTTDVDDVWAITQIPFEYADRLVFKFITDLENMSSIESPADLTDDKIVFLRNEQNLSFTEKNAGAYYIFVGAVIYDETTSQYINLPDIYKVSINQASNPDLTIYDVYTIKDMDGNIVYDENGEIINTPYGSSLLVPNLTKDQLPYELELNITIEGDEIHAGMVYTAHFTIKQ